MPYALNSELPVALRHLPEGAQTIYRKAFNAAWRNYGGNPRREEISHRVAWSAVKRRYRKVGERWVVSGSSAGG